MADARSPLKVDPGLIAEIVTSYVGKNPIGIDQIGSLIASVHRTLSGLGNRAPVPPPGPLAPAVPIRRSVRPDYVVCLECGFRGLMLRRHLRVAHGLDPVAYRTRWKLSADHPLTAPAYSEQRSTMAKQIGLGRTRQEADVPPPSTGETPPAPPRRGRPRRPAAS
ncbi:MAG TPA: MucR family transcriptional regulator [Bradyrhizobium sp.]|jgi:predicted transcriptional regulator